ncbi:hypothetical protein I79_015058 [Cricetulus griseus]|uniref:Uncharacterized protein n=1 Tax=Cricetulus griseus TaxID=10029 RepID=G3HVR7_CRIGR|nr:hypothetical protein I79_015058 [Cricetulus griseus]
MECSKAMVNNDKIYTFSFYKLFVIINILVIRLVLKKCHVRYKDTIHNPRLLDKNSDRKCL